ncbi:toxin [Shewanella sp. WE21]|uniref:Tc toxin subunit A n=1 Tax=Shewanella sp. WE21 TaxID=2029986 RepID=UPI000CF74C75|nr:Tc toxin subunit A [Shewanella sp. WE21]AVI65868.1 toxin [Shewanella sp. WE21]
MHLSRLHSASEEKLVIILNEAGYQTIFDIIRQSRAAFVKTTPDIDAVCAQQIYRHAREHADTLKSLFRSWQLRQEPVIGGLKKLAPSPSLHLKEALLRNLGGDGDFSDLMARSTDYADAASIQSLFSPGRYAAALYKVAKTLHNSNSAFHIDNRRPDLQDLILSETTMNQELTSLDLLLEVLQSDENNTLSSLSKSFFPMTLPYDDKLTQINTALGAQARTLNGIWDVLFDTQASAFAVEGQSIKRSALPDESSGKPFFLKTQEEGEMIYLAHAVDGGDALPPGGYLNVGRPQVETPQTANLHFSRKNGLLYLSIAGDVTINGIHLAGSHLMANNGTDFGGDGSFARMARPDDNSNINPAKHLAITLEAADNDNWFIQTPKGYLGHEEKGLTDAPKRLTLDAQKEDALLFAFCSDVDGAEVIAPETLLPPNTSPNPPARVLLNLTPVSYQLMANTSLTDEDIRDHYGLLAQSAREDSTLAEALNNIPTFCEKTGLTFNQVLDLTAQYSYEQSGGTPGDKNKHPMSRFRMYGMESIPDVHQYGAAFINSKVEPSTENALLWIQPEIRKNGVITTPAALNFRDDTVVSLAGNAEKIIRLHNTTGLSFEMLDWIIVQASHAASYDPLTLDSVTLGVLASCVDFKQRYGISENVFASFIGAVNPYAPAQEKSLYETLFTYPDETGCIPIGQQVTCNGEGDQAVYESTCAKALGVTSDEFARIVRYCFGSDATSFTMDENTAGQIYRFGAIPRMLGLTFAEAECLWLLMAEGTDTLLKALGCKTGLAAIDLIRRTEQVLGWMRDNDLNLIQVQAMVSKVYSGTATAEMFTFLQNTYRSVKDSPSGIRKMDAALRQKVLRALAGGFGMKTNIMGPVTEWLTKTDGNLTLDVYWNSIATFFENPQNTSVDDLQKDTTGLVAATQRLSQLVLVARWLNLSEQDLRLLTETPAQLDDSLPATLQPSLYLLLLLTRFKRWQGQVTTSVDEALRLLPVLVDAESDANTVADKIAVMHNLTTDSVSTMNTLIFGEGEFPHSFAQLYKLLTWLRTGQMLNVGSTTLYSLLTMAQNDENAEDSDLIARVADTLTAGLTR